MAKKKYWKLEYSIALFVMLGVLLLIMPLSIESTRQANFISKWNEKYNRVEYMFQVINAHITDDLLKSFNKAKSSEEREKLLLQLIKPYLRVNTEMDAPKKHYRPKYMNKVRVYKGQTYYFDEFYFAENNTIVGIKDIHSENPEDALFMMMFDMNGILPPNRWGKDIFGVSIFDGRIEPFGQGQDMSELKKDCSESGTGISCSYYYKIGGGFDEK